MQGGKHERQNGADVFVLGVGAYVPAGVMTNEDWARHVDTSDEWITARTGIKRRHIAAEHETTADLAVAAASDALANASLSAASITEIIVATDTPEMYIPDTASFVQHRLGAGQIPAYDVSAGGCAGFLQALDIARSRVTSDGGVILVIGVQLLLRLIDWSDRTTCVLFGDAAGAVLVGSTPGRGKILGIVSATDGSHFDLIGLPVGGTRAPFTLERAQQNLHRRVSFEGRTVFKHAVRRMTQAAETVLANTGHTVGEISLIVPHQANLRIIEAVARNLETSMEKFFVHIEEYGNTGPASLPLALSCALAEGRIHSGDLVLLTTFGAGLHWGAGLLQF